MNDVEDPGEKQHDQPPPRVRTALRRGAFPTPESEITAATPYVPEVDPAAESSEPEPYSPTDNAQ